MARRCLYQLSASTAGGDGGLHGSDDGAVDGEPGLKEPLVHLRICRPISMVGNVMVGAHGYAKHAEKWRSIEVNCAIFDRAGIS